MISTTLTALPHTSLCHTRHAANHTALPQTPLRHSNATRSNSRDPKAISNQPDIAKSATHTSGEIRVPTTQNSRPRFDRLPSFLLTENTPTPSPLRTSTPSASSILANNVLHPNSPKPLLPHLRLQAHRQERCAPQPPANLAGISLHGVSASFHRSRRQEQDLPAQTHFGNSLNLQPRLFHNGDPADSAKTLSPKHPRTHH